MPVIVAHEDTCDIATKGVRADVPVCGGMVTVNTLCTCGGVYYRVNPNLGGVNFHRIKEPPGQEEAAT